MNQNNWITILKTNKPYQLDILKGKLEEYEIPSVIVNKIDSSYLQFGEAELKIKISDKEKAEAILNQSNE